MAKRQRAGAPEKAAEVFARELREASGRVINHLATNDHVHLKDVYQAHVWAAFDLLEMALRAGRMYRGIMPPAPTASPSSRIAERAEIFKEMMQLIGDELLAIDPTHDYAVGLLQRRRGVPKA